jgi:hypothetical protein
VINIGLWVDLFGLAETEHQILLGDSVDRRHIGRLVMPIPLITTQLNVM